MSPAALQVGFPEAGVVAEAVRQELAELCAGDHSYDGGSIFNSICSAPLPLAAEVFRTYLHTNGGDNRLFPSLPRAEERVIQMLADLLGLPAAQGCLTSGGTEANLLAMAVALEIHRERAGRGEPPEIVAPETVHFSFDKIARLLGARLVRTGLDGHLRGDPEAIARRVGPRTAAVVVSAGASETGAVDDVEAAARIARRHGLRLHVDAATGGFLIPFAAESYRGPRFDFGLPEVASITVDPHKYGQAPIPAGALLMAREEDFARLRFASHYAGTQDHHTLLGTRPGAATLAVYATLRHLGRTGYLALAKELFARRDHLLARLAGEGFSAVVPPDLTIVAVAVDDCQGMARYLEERGLMVSVSRRFSFLRIVIQRHLTEPALDRLVSAMAAFRGLAGASA
jgi:tyrosine decarboxylase/aspartate 1-decarboxylase